MTAASAMMIDELELEKGIRNARCAWKEWMWWQCLTTKEYG
jgi:hypothetical protein